MSVLSNLRVPIVFILLLYSLPSYAQTTVRETDSLVNKINYYGIKQSRSVLFAHFDKNVYVNNENVWFTAYLLGYNKDKNNPSVLSAMLVNDYNKSVALEQKFVMVNGLALGNVFIPDSIPPGNYSFLLYTNVLTNGKPTDTFIQPITIKTASRPAISASLVLLDTDKIIPGAERKIRLNVATKDDRPIPQAAVVYYLGNGTYHLISGKIKTDQAGEYTFSIPDNQIKAGANEFTADIKYNKEVKHIKLLLPVKENPVSVKFYPEGGNLVHATQSTVGWETRDANGAPVSVKGVLYKDKRAVDTILTDRYGMGSFKLIPLMDSKYELRLTGEQKDTVYTLPKILIKGPVISIQHAIANDTLRLNLVSKYPGKFFLMVHNYKQTFFSFPVQLNAVHKTVAVVLKYIPKGLNTITVLDSLQRPCAERIFFAHYDQHASISVNTDSANYHTRQKVHLKLKLNNGDTDTLKGAVSVACIQSNRIDVAKSNDIESYVYLKHELEDIPLKEKFMGQGREDMIYLENILLIKGWRRYNWTDMLQTKARDTMRNVTTIPPFEGVVTNYGKAVKKSTQVMVLTDSMANIITTDQRGHFILKVDNMTNNNGRKIHLVLKDQTIYYSIKKLGGFNITDSLLVKEFKPSNYSRLANNASTDVQMVKGNEHAINLREVKITGARKETYGLSHLYDGEHKNICGDYVCRYNFLNCTYHPFEPDNRAPIVGETYNINRGGTIIYKGCPIIPESQSVDAIVYSKEFYSEDYSIVNPSQPEYVSTIYWKHLCFVNSKGELNLNFYTSDITGPFRVVVQGITAHDVIYGEKEFNVKKP